MKLIFRRWRFKPVTTHLRVRCVFWILERSKSKNRHSCHRIRRGMVLDSFYLPYLATKFSEKKKLLNTSIAWAKSEGLDRIGTSLYFYWMHQEIVWPFKGEIGWFRRQQFAISFHFTFIPDFSRFAKHACSVSVQIMITIIGLLPVWINPSDGQYYQNTPVTQNSISLVDWRQEKRKK